MRESKSEREYLDHRLDTICEGLKEGVRREVAELKEFNLPVLVANNGTIIDANSDKASSRRTR